ncbi:MAG: beta-ketoacyl-ACP synthase II [Chloroflexi bacterium]|nr:beta-ketoacyl-ACP synthase II [Chloroflexota bacterium]
MSTRVFVTGLGVVSPLGLDAASTWNNLVGGVSGIVYITAFDTQGFETRIAGEVKGFDPTEYLDKKQARHMDRFAQFAAVASQEALWQAELKLEELDPNRVAVIVGSGVGGIITMSQQWEVLKERGPTRVSPFLLPMMLADMAPGQLSMILGAKGPNFCPVSSCSSGADAIGHGWHMIRRGDADVVIAGGAEAPICPIAVAGFNACQALSRHNVSPKEASRPFDAQRDGFVIGEGAGILVLESLESVRRRNVPALAELVGYAATSDAYHVTQPAPDAEGEVRAMRLALEAAGLKPGDIGYINAHGTSTPLNDKFETMAIKAVFGEEAYHIPVSSTKSMMGHMLGAGGAVEAAISIMALNRWVIPPTINLEHPDPECDLDYVPNRARRCEIRTAMSNSFGFGGHNSSLVFQAPEDHA